MKVRAPLLIWPKESPGFELRIDADVAHGLVTEVFVEKDFRSQEPQDTKKKLASLCLGDAIGSRLVVGRSPFSTTLRLDILVKTENVLGIILLLDLHQTIIVCAISGCDALALVGSHEVYVNACGGKGR